MDPFNRFFFFSTHSPRLKKNWSLSCTYIVGSKVTEGSLAFVKSEANSKQTLLINPLHVEGFFFFSSPLHFPVYTPSIHPSRCIFINFTDCSPLLRPLPLRGHPPKWTFCWSPCVFHFRSLTALSLSQRASAILKAGKNVGHTLLRTSSLKNVLVVRRETVIKTINPIELSADHMAPHLL